MVRRLWGGRRAGTEGGLVGQVEQVVVREPGRWTSAPLGSEVLSDLRLPAVLELAGDPPKARVDGDLPPAVELVTPLLLPVVGGRLGLFPPGEGEAIPMDRVEVAVLDRLVGAMSVEALAQELGLPLPEVSAAVHRLLAGGALAPCQEARPVAPAQIDGPREVTPRPLGSGVLRPLDPTRIPVVSAHLPQFGPPLALGMVLAYARVWDGGRLADRYEFRSPVTVEEARSLLADHEGPAILLCSNYVWSYRENLALVAELSARNPDLVTIHGGPHTPKYERDQHEFLAQPGVDIAVMGEGEQTAVELLAALAEADRFGDRSNLHGVAGLAFLDRATGELVRTGERERIADLEILPSPYLSGEFDELHPATWDPGLGGTVIFETNRGCPYKCSFCDWGSATMSRIRKFSMERVEAEMRWLADHDLAVWMVADSNFGILPRDIEIARQLVALHQETGLPTWWGVNTAKNASRALSEIISLLCDEGIAVLSSLALQSRDEETLRAIDRSNISPDRYDELAVAFRSRRLPLTSDLVLGLPGSTPASFKADLQWTFDHQITPRVWVCQVLPNAPMNDEAYRERYALVLDEDDVVVASSTFTRADRSHMMDLRMAERTFVHLGILRHVLSYVQWDLGIPAMDVLERLVEVTRRDASRFPCLSWARSHLDGLLVTPISWPRLYAETAELLEQEFGIRADPALETVLRVQQALMPERRRSYPDLIHLAHDYVAYYLQASESLHRDGSAARASQPLSSYGAGVLEVRADPAAVAAGFRRLYEVRPPDLLPGEFWHVSHFELDSPLTRSLAEVRATPGFTSTSEARTSAHPGEAGPSHGRQVPVLLRSGSSPADRSP